MIDPVAPPSSRTYLRVVLRSESVYDPVTIFRDVDSQGREVRRLELFRDGRCGYATADDAWGGTVLSNEAAGGAVVISREEFLAVWSRRDAQGPPVRAPLAAPLTRNEAILVVDEYLARMASKAQIPLALLPERTITKSYGWVFFFDSVQFVETRDPLLGIGGNGPIVVERDSGRIHQLGSHRPVDEMIAAFERATSAGPTRRPAP